MKEISGLWWIFLIIILILPSIKQHRLEISRIALMRKFEKSRGSRLITLIHRQESISLLGIPLSKFINIEDSEQVLRAIRMTPDDMPIDLVLHTPGGLVLASEQIAHALKNHPAKITVFVPHYAMSGGTMIALTADEIIMDENAVLGPVDPQLGQYPAVSILQVVKEKDKNEIDDSTLIMADMAKKALLQVKEFVFNLLTDKMTKEKAEEIANLLSQGKWTHDYPITYEELNNIGLPVKKDLPNEIYQLMEFYPQPAQRRPSVQYIPLPYQGETKRKV